MTGPTPAELTPLHFLERSGSVFGARVVPAVEGGARVTRTWAELRDGARVLRSALARVGIRRGDRVASLAWNTHRHVELYFGVPASGAVLLTVNVRLASSQVRTILDHAGAEVVFAEAEFVPLVDEALAGRPGPRHRVVLDGGGAPGWMPFAAFVDGAGADASLGLPADERDGAGLCYTSGTTGEPKGVLYTHRAVALHTLGIALPDGFGLGQRDVILPAVPMFHAHAWGLVHVAAMTGASLVLPGARPSPERLAALLEEEQVTFAAGVPTVWMGVLDQLRARPRALSPGLRIHSGGAPTPGALIENYRRELGVEVVTGWGMTELTPVGSVTHPRASMDGWDDEALLDVRTSQGTPLPFVEARVVDANGMECPSDGVTPGELEVRGPWVASSYYRADSPEAFRDGWLRTGDVATRDGLGYVRLVDRTKDLIRSGGEWISSVQLENAVMAHPAVAEAAVVAVPDAKWGERPWACVALRPGMSAAPEELLAPLADAVPSWWIPDRVVFTDALPRTATGKFDKKALRSALARER